MGSNWFFFLSSLHNKDMWGKNIKKKKKAGNRRRAVWKCPSNHHTHLLAAICFFNLSLEHTHMKGCLAAQRGKHIPTSKSINIPEKGGFSKINNVVNLDCVRARWISKYCNWIQQYYVPKKPRETVGFFLWTAVAVYQLDESEATIRHFISSPGVFLIFFSPQEVVKKPKPCLHARNPASSHN